MSSLTPNLVKTLPLLMLSNEISFGISRLRLVRLENARYSTTILQNAELKLPKYPMPAFMRFRMKEDQSVVAASPTLSITQVSTILGKRWRELSEAEKQIYQAEASNDLVKYKSEMAKIESDPELKDQLQQIKEEKKTAREEKSQKKLRKKYLKALQEKRQLESDLDRPKHKTNAFNIFASQKLTTGMTLPQTQRQEEFSKLTKLWSSLNPEEKEVYLQMVRKLSDKYKNDLKQWKLKLSNDQIDDIKNANEKITSIRKMIKNKGSVQNGI